MPFCEGFVVNPRVITIPPFEALALDLSGLWS
jgi:hypothetical protein